MLYFKVKVVLVLHMLSIYTSNFIPPPPIQNGNIKNVDLNVTRRAGLRSSTLPQNHLVIHVGSI